GAELLLQDQLLLDLPRLGEGRGPLALEIQHDVDGQHVLLEQAVARLHPPGIEAEGAGGLLREHVVEGHVPVVGEPVLQLHPVHGRGLVEAADHGRFDLVPDLQLEIPLRLRHVLVGPDQGAPVGARLRGGEGGGEDAESESDSQSQLRARRHRSSRFRTVQRAGLGWDCCWLQRAQSPYNSSLWWVTLNPCSCATRSWSSSMRSFSNSTMLPQEVQIRWSWWWRSSAASYRVCPPSKWRAEASPASVRIFIVR